MKDALKSLPKVISIVTTEQMMQTWADHILTCLCAMVTQCYMTEEKERLSFHSMAHRTL